MHLLVSHITERHPQLVLYHITLYNLFSFRGSVQNYKIHMDMEIVKLA